MSTEQIIIDLSIEGVDAGRQKLDAVKQSIIAIRTEIERLGGRTDPWSTAQLERFNRELLTATTSEAQLTRAIASTERQLATATNATTALTAAQQRAATQATSTSQAMSSAFNVVSQTVQTMGAVTDSAFRDFANQQFPRWGELSRSELSILQQSYQQATTMVELNNGAVMTSLQMESLAMQAFRGNINDVALAMTNYQTIMRNNVGADAISTTTAAMVALRAQISSGGYAVNGLNAELGNMGINANGSLMSTSQLIQNLEKNVKGMTESFKILGFEIVGIGNELFVDTENMAKFEASVKKSIMSASQLQKAYENINLILKDNAAGIRNPSFSETTQGLLQSYQSSIVGLRDQISLLEREYELLDAEERRAFDPTRLIKLKAELAGASLAVGGLTSSARNAVGTGFNPLTNSIMQMGRELPNFAMSARIGIMAISNNLPIMADEIRKASVAYKEYTRQVAAGVQGLTAVPSPMKAITSALFSFNSALSLATVAMVLFTNEGTLKWLKSLFDIEKYISKADLATRSLLNTMNDKSSAAANNTKKIFELGVAIDKYKTNTLSANEQTQTGKKIVDDYNSTLGVHYGKLKTVNEVLLNYGVSAKKYIEWTIAMSTATKLADEAAEQRLRGMASRRSIAELNLSKLETDILNREYNKRLEAFVAYGLKHNNLDEKSATYQKDLNKLKLELQSNFYTRMESEDDDFHFYYQSNLIKNSKVSLDVQRKFFKERTIDLMSHNLETNKINSAVKLFPGDISTTKPESSSSNRVNTTSDPSKPQLELQKQFNTQVITLYVNRLIETSRLNSEERIIQQYAIKSQADGFKQSVSLQRKYEVDLQNAKLQDSKNKVSEVEMEIDLKKWSLTENVKLAQQKIALLNSTSAIEYAIVGKFNDEILRKETLIYNEQVKLHNLKKEDSRKYTDEQKKDLEKRINNQQLNLDRVKGTQQSEIDLLKKQRSESQKIVDSATAEAKKISDELQNTQGKTVSEINTLKESLKGLNATIVANQNIVNQQKKNAWVQGLEDAIVAAEKLNGVLNAGSKVAEVGMLWTNRKFDNEKKALEASSEYNQANTDQQANMMYELEMKRYNALKVNFENKKKLDMGVVAVEAISSEMGAIKNFIANGGVTSPWAWAGLAAETITIGATAAASISEINARQLDAPVKPTSKSSGSANANVALNPNKTSMKTSQENLNMMQTSNKSTQGETVVKVTDINKVQSIVKVRENNSSY